LKRGDQWSWPAPSIFERSRPALSPEIPAVRFVSCIVATPYNSRGDIKYYKQDLGGALADYTRAIELEADDRSSVSSVKPSPLADYAELHIWLVRKRLGQAGAANQELSTYLQKRGKPNDWTSVIGAYLVGQAAEEKLFAAAESTDKEKDRGQHCQAWFYAGMKKLLEGDKKTASDYFQKCLATDETIYPEFALAAAELRNLNH
jgi:lipoprotein NlpI